MLVLTFLGIGLGGSATAHAPSDADLAYDLDDGMLTVTVSHDVADPESHYIAQISVYKNDVLYESRPYSEQPSDSSVTAAFDIDAEAGDEIRVTAVCSQGQSITKTLVVKAPADGGEEKEEEGGIMIGGYDLDEPLPYVGFSIWGILIFLLAVVVGLLVVMLVARLIKKAFLRLGVNEILAEFGTRIIRIILILFVLSFALAFLNIYLAAYFAGFSVVMGLVLGLAMADSLGSIFAGLMISISKPFKKGDYIVANGVEGSVKSVGISVTELDTGDNKHVIIPNKNVWSNNIVNFTMNKRRRVDMEVGIAYESNLNKALRATMKLVKSHPKVLTKFEPVVAVKDLGDSAIILVVRPWVKTEDYWTVFFDLKKAIKEKYDELGIAIPFPQMEMHLIKQEKSG